MVAPRTPREVADWAADAQRELALLLATREKSPHRVITLSESFAKLSSLNLKQDSLMREALHCVEQGLYRPAHVAAWAALIDYTQEWVVGGDRLPALTKARAKWNVKVAPDLRLFTDFALIEALEAAGLITRTMMKALHGLLNKRNECAHPEDYSPTLNDTLGYVDELMKRIATLGRARVSGASE
jgi:glycerophosphoryl diester phosphodiesterase